MRRKNQTVFGRSIAGCALALGAVSLIGVKVPVSAAVPVLAADVNTAIRSVDFRNFSYDAGEGEVITTKNGEYFREDPDDKLYLQVVGVDYGDLDGNKTEEAAVWLLLNTGGTGQFTYTEVFQLVGGKPKRAALTAIGDRADDGIHDVFVDAGQLVEDRYSNGQGACCPNEISRFRYRLTGSKLVSTGSKPKRSVVFLGAEATNGTAVSLKFLKGTSASTLYTDNTQPVDVTLSARAGQTIVIKPVQTRDTSGLPGVSVFDNGKRVVSTTGKAITAKLATGKVRLTFTGEGFVDIAIR